MFKEGQLIRSKITETVYLILESNGYYYKARILASTKFTRVGHFINLTMDFDGEVLANNYILKGAAFSNKQLKGA